MGNWVVIAEYYSDTHRTEFICRGQETKDQALKALRAALHTYLPSKNIVDCPVVPCRWRAREVGDDQTEELAVVGGR
ncbi:hypothetical protein GCM10010270_83330 [Streptomyces violaceus]|nr:hypothetical protein GCM10010270_83330 [Streptomyces janthinus]